MNPANLVIFDCDGVLVDTEHLVQRVEMAMIADLGWPITISEMNEQHLGRSWHTIQANIERQIGRPLPPSFRSQAVTATHQLFEDELTTVAGIEAAYEQLVSSGYATCVASSGSHERIRFTLGITGLLSKFEGRIFSAEDVRRGKPNPDLFLHAATQSGFNPSACVVVEDSPAGVSAARAAGMPVVGFHGRTPSALLTEADVLIQDMSELHNAVTNLIHTR